MLRNNDRSEEIEICGPIIHSFMNLSTVIVNEKLIVSGWHLVRR